MPTTARSPLKVIARAAERAGEGTPQKRAFRNCIAVCLHHSELECPSFEHFTRNFGQPLYNPDNPLREIPDVQFTGDTARPLENIMFVYILEKLSNWFESAERNRREAYLAASSDVVDLERRLRSLAAHGYSL